MEIKGQLLQAPARSDKRSLTVKELSVDFLVAGGGLAGVCAAVTAAREGLSVALVQDRPVLGGNASSEVRLWALGATSHMGNNNRWAREGGVIDEILVENTFRNKEGNPVIFDTVVLDIVLSEPNITLLLNTALYDVEKEGGDKIKSIYAFNPQNGTEYHISAKLFCDATGDGTLAYLSGAAYRLGAEDKEEFGECFSPSEKYGRLLGHTISLYAKKTDHPVKFYPPSYAMKDITVIPKYEQITSDRYGCNYWWFEYGGELDTVHDSEKIKFELWKVVYGAWNYIKNSGRFPEAENMTLEWVGTIPGKRESRRFIGHYMLTQKDVVEQADFYDAVAFGGWAIDLHPAAGVYSDKPSCNQYHSKGTYSIPYRCYISKDISNLFYAGRIISTSHVAFGSTRVMTTCGHGAQAVGMAASMCVEENLLPASLLKPSRMAELQQRLNVAGQSIRKLPIDGKCNLLTRAVIKASSELSLGLMPESGKMSVLTYSAAQLLPLAGNTEYTFFVDLTAEEDTSLEMEFAVSSIRGNFTPDRIMSSRIVPLHRGIQRISVDFGVSLDEDGYAFVIFRSNPKVSLPLTDFRCTGILSVFNKFNYAVNNNGKQTPPEGSGFDSFEFWCPDRRPEGQNIAMSVSPALKSFGASNLLNGFVRPVTAPNAWIASPQDKAPSLDVIWEKKQTFSRMRLYLDTDYDHPMETVQYGHPENIMPFCVSDIEVYDAEGKMIASVYDNHRTIVDISFDGEICTDRLRLELANRQEDVPVSVFGIIVS